MKDLVDAVEAADGFWPVAAIAIIGIYVLLWRYLGKILDAVRGVHKTTENIDSSIITNHGSKNIGDAIDRLYEMQQAESSLAKIRHEVVEARLDRLETGVIGAA